MGTKRIRLLVTLAGLGLLMAMGVACSSGTPAAPTAAPTKAAAAPAAPAAATSAPAAAAPAAATSAPAAAASGAAKVVKIGSVQSTSGPNASFGVQALDGIQFGVKYINAQGGFTVGGQKYNLELVQYDDTSKPDVAVSNIQKLIDQDKVKVVFGPGSSAAALPAQKVTEPAKAIYFLTVASVEALTDGTAKYTFRNAAIVTIADRAIVQFIKSLGINKVASVARQDESAQAGAKAAKDEMQKLGIALAGDEQFTTGTTDFYSILTKIKGNEPGAIIANMGRTEGIPFTKQARELGIKAPIFGWVDWVSTDFVNGVGTAVSDPVYGYSTAFTSVNDKIKTYVGDFQKSMGKTSPMSQDLNGFDGVMLVVEAMKAAGTVDDTDKIADAMRKLSYDGVLGHYSFTPNGQARMQLNINLIQKGDVAGVPKTEIPGDKLPY